MFKRVRNTLRLSTGSGQISWEHTSLIGDFFFSTSTGRRMTDYGADAISDSQFLLKPSTKVRDAIDGLKSYNWYKQNPALAALADVDLTNDTTDALFVLGRNIYQAACGGANAADTYIKEFRNKTAGIEPERRKAILDGMLFEIFFNSKGELRKDFKTSKFEDLFELSKVPDFEASFALISEVLTPYQSRFVVLPGRTRPVNVDVQTVELDTGERLITGIFVDAANVLRTSRSSESPSSSSYPIRHEKLVQQICTGLLMPSLLVTVTPDYDISTARLLIPMDAEIGR